MGLLIYHSWLFRYKKRCLCVSTYMEMNVYEVFQWRVSVFPPYLALVSSVYMFCLNWKSEQASVLTLPQSDHAEGLRSTWVRENVVSVDHPRVRQEHLLVNEEEPPYPLQSSVGSLQGLSPSVILPLYWISISPPTSLERKCSSLSRHCYLSPSTIFLWSCSCLMLYSVTCELTPQAATIP